MGSELILVTGGARSGKSTFAEKLCAQKGKNVAYIATAEALDEGMKARIQRHRSQRPENWETFESPQNVDKVIKELHQKDYDIAMVDCLTVLTTNLFLSDKIDWDTASRKQIDQKTKSILCEMDQLIEAVLNSEIPVVLVTNEVGLGIVPDNRMARIFRDIAGWVNQKVAGHAHSVYFVVSGIPLQIKGEA